MGKRIIQQARGKGSPTYRVPQMKLKPKITYRNMHGKVIDIVNYPLMDAPLAQIQYTDKTVAYMVAPQGMKVGDSTEQFIFPLSAVTEGTHVFAIETYPHSGPKLCRSPGSFATLVSKGKSDAVIQLPSKKTKTVNLQCRVVIGIPAGEGRSEKPYAKAGPKWHAMHARGKLYPRTSGNRMNIVDHPFGGSGHGKRRPPVSRHAPPGRKVGSVSPRRTGKK